MIPNNPFDFEFTCSVSLNGDAVMKVRSNREEQFPMDVDITVSKSKMSPSITSPIASHFPLIPSKGIFIASYYFQLTLLCSNSH